MHSNVKNIVVVSSSDVRNQLHLLYLHIHEHVCRRSVHARTRRDNAAALPAVCIIHLPKRLKFNAHRGSSFNETFNAVYVAFGEDEVMNKNRSRADENTQGLVLSGVSLTERAQHGSPRGDVQGVRDNVALHTEMEKKRQKEILALSRKDTSEEVIKPGKKAKVCENNEGRGRGQEIIGQGSMRSARLEDVAIRRRERGGEDQPWFLYPETQHNPLHPPPPPCFFSLSSPALNFPLL